MSNTNDWLNTAIGIKHRSPSRLFFSSLMLLMSFVAVYIDFAFVTQEKKPSDMCVCCMKRCHSLDKRWRLACITTFVLAMIPIRVGETESLPERLHGRKGDVIEDRARHAQLKEKHAKEAVIRQLMELHRSRVLVLHQNPRYGLQNLKKRHTLFLRTDFPNVRSMV